MLLTFCGLLVAWVTSSLFAPVFHACTGWIIRPFATFQIRYHIRHSSILPKQSQDKVPSLWKRIRRFLRGVPVNAQHSFLPRPSPVSQLLERWLSGKPRLEHPRFSGLSSYVLYLPSSFGKTKACEYFMLEKKARGVMLRGGKRSGRPYGASYEEAVRRNFGGLCWLLSLDDFRKSFVNAMKDESLLLPCRTDPENVIIFFDDFDEVDDTDYLFAKDVMHAFTSSSINVVPIFITQTQEIANRLCYLNRGAKIRPFPECMEDTCRWNVGCGKERYIVGDEIGWKFPVWTHDDMLRITQGQLVRVDCDATCGLTSFKKVPMMVPPDRSSFDGLDPGAAMKSFSSYTRQQYSQQQYSQQQDRREPLLDIEMPGTSA